MINPECTYLISSTNRPPDEFADAVKEANSSTMSPSL